MREINYTDSRKEEKKWQQRVGVVPGLALLANVLCILTLGLFALKTCCHISRKWYEWIHSPYSRLVTVDIKINRLTAANQLYICLLHIFDSAPQICHNGSIKNSTGTYTIQHIKCLIV
jgi:hypothetical protein